MPSRMARVRRLHGQDGEIQEAFVNPDQVKYVFPQPPGSYIAFNENLDVEPNSSKRLVKPMGISSPDTVEVVMRRLHRPYRADLWIKIITLAVSVGAIVVAIVFT